MTDTTQPAVADKWDKANTATRDAAKWVVVALGALGVAVYGATPLVRAFDLDWNDPKDLTQLWIATVTGVLGLTTVIVLILRVGYTLVMTVGSRSVADETKRKVEREPEQWLPSQVKTIHALKELIKQTDLERLELQAKPDESSREDLQVVLGDLNALQAWMNQIVRLDSYLRIRRQFFGPLTIFLAMAAGVASLVFSLALASGSADSKSDADDKSSSAVTPQVGYLSKGPDQKAADSLYASLHLDECVVGSRVPVVVVSTNGQQSTVQTIPSDTCSVRQFTVIGEVVTLDLALTPETVTVTYSPSPTSDGSR